MKEKEFIPENNKVYQYVIRLLSAIATANADKGLQNLIEIGYQMLENPILITDKSWKAIAMTSNVEIPDDTGWNEFLTNGLLSAESVTSGIRENLAERIDQSTAPFRWQSPDMKYARLFNKLTLNGKSIATISVIEYNRSFTENDYILLEILGKAVTAEMQKSQFQQFTRGMLFEQLIENLLEGRLKDAKFIEDRVKLLNIGINKYIYVLVIDVIDFDSKQYSVSYMRDMLEKMIRGGRALIYDNKIIIIVSYACAEAIWKKELKDFAVFLKKNNMRCGISRPCTQLSEIRFFYEQALDALRVGTHMDYEKNIYPYEQYAIYHIAEACSKPGGPGFFCHPALKKLIAHDHENKTSFTNSLYQYIRHFRNISNTANILHLHRNTMIYHLQRIEEIMGISLSDYDTMQMIELSFRFLEYDKELVLRSDQE
jgi:sugar diacid utilization regulator